MKFKAGKRSWEAGNGFNVVREIEGLVKFDHIHIHSPRRGSSVGFALRFEYTLRTCLGREDERPDVTRPIVGRRSIKYSNFRPPAAHPQLSYTPSAQRHISQWRFHKPPSPKQRGGREPSRNHSPADIWLDDEKAFQFPFAVSAQNLILSTPFARLLFGYDATAREGDD